MSDFVTALCNQTDVEAFVSDLGDDQSRYLSGTMANIAAHVLLRIRRYL